MFASRTIGRRASYKTNLENPMISIGAFSPVLSFESIARRHAKQTQKIQ